MSLCKYGRPGHPCSHLRIMDMPTRKIRYGDGTTSIRSKKRYQPLTPPRSPSSGSPRSRRLSSHEESADEAAPLRHKARNDSSTRKSDRRTHRRERREPKERIVVVDAPNTPKDLSNRFSRVPTPPSSPDNPVYYSRGRPVIVDEGPIRRMPRSPTPFYDEENRRVLERGPSRDRGRPAIRRSYSRPEVRYDWDTPPKKHATWIVGERRGRRESYGGREVRDRRSSWSDNERRGRRASFSDQEIWEKKEKRSPFSDPVGEVRAGKRRVRRLSSTGDREERKETRSMYSDPERERRRERRERRASSSDPEKEQRRRERRASSSDQERELRRRERRKAIVDAEREDRRERRTSTSDPEKEQRRERRRSSIIMDSDREERKERRSILADSDREARKERHSLITAPDREERKERRQRRATFSEYDRPIMEEAPMPPDPESEHVGHDEVRSSHSDPGRHTSPEREREREREERRRRRHNREVRNYQEAERRRARQIAEQNNRIHSRPPKPSGTKLPKPILKQRRTEPYPEPGEGQGPGQVKAVTIDDKNIVDAGAALKRRQEDRGKKYRARLDDLDREAQKRRLKERMTRSASVDRYRDRERDFEDVDGGGRAHRRRSSRGVIYEDEGYRYEP